jgi:hypothetical protein
VKPIRPDSDSAQFWALEQRIRRLENATGRIVDVQRLNGQNNAYRAISTATSFTVDAAGTIPLALSYTPPVDVWWEVHANIGVLQKIDAAYHYAYGQLELLPADVDSVSSAPNILTQHTSVDDYGWRGPQRIWKLAAGTAYTCTANFSPAGGLWQFYQGRDYMFIEGKAWTR